MWYWVCLLFKGPADWGNGTYSLFLFHFQYLKVTVIDVPLWVPEHWQSESLQWQPLGGSVGLSVGSPYPHDGLQSSSPQDLRDVLNQDKAVHNGNQCQQISILGDESLKKQKGFGSVKKSWTLKDIYMVFPIGLCGLQQKWYVVRLKWSEKTLTGPCVNRPRVKCLVFPFGGMLISVIMSLLMSELQVKKNKKNWNIKLRRKWRDRKGIACDMHIHQ